GRARRLPAADHRRRLGSRHRPVPGDHRVPSDGPAHRSPDADLLSPRAMPRGITIANAPVSYGAFELTVGRDPNVPDGIGVLDQVAAAGYEGIDLGPAGYLGLGTELAERLATRKLALAGAYLELPFADEAALGVTLPALDQILDIFDGVPVPADRPPPRPTLADAGSDARRAHPGRSARDPGFGHDAAAW